MTDDDRREAAAVAEVYPRDGGWDTPMLAGLRAFARAAGGPEHDAKRVWIDVVAAVAHADREPLTKEEAAAARRARWGAEGEREAVAEARDALARLPAALRARLEATLEEGGIGDHPDVIEAIVEAGRRLTEAAR